MTDTRIKRLGLHLGVTSLLLQKGTQGTILKQQLVTLRDVAKDVIDADDIPSADFIQVVQLLPDGVVDGLCENEIAPDDLSSFDLSEPEEDEEP